MRRLLLSVLLVLVGCSSQASVDSTATEPATAQAPVPGDDAGSSDDRSSEELLTPSPLPTASAPVAATAPPSPTTTPAPGPTATALPTSTPASTPTPRPDGPCGVGPLALPDPNRPVYDVQLDVDPATQTVVGSMTVDFTPDLAIDEIVLRLWPNGPRTSAAGVTLTLGRVTVDGRAVEVEFDDPTLARIALADEHPAGEPVRIGAFFDLVVPARLKSRLSGDVDHMRLGTIVPLLPWHPGRGWQLDPPTALFAEAVASPVADWTVHVTVPEGFDVLASGEFSRGAWRVEAARDFALTVGRFRTVTRVVDVPEPVTITVGAHESVPDDPLEYLNKVADSMEQFSERFGQYPWPTLTLALTPDLSGGIEFPTHIMQGPGTIGRTTSHEVAHMWFYSLVGNNQGADPWLDEGLASYVEFTYEGTPPGAFDIPSAGRGRATESMSYWEPRAELYYRSVYAQPGFAFQLLGERGDVDCALAQYVADNAHRIATGADLVAAFEPTFPNAAAQLADLGVIID